MPLFHAFAWGFGSLACVGMVVARVSGSQPNSPCWLDSVEKNAGALRGPRLVLQLFPLTQLLAVAVSLLVLLRVALLLGRNTAQVTPYRRRVLGRGLLYVGAYGVLGILKLIACLVMLGLHSDGTQPPAQQAFAYSESALLLALALVDAGLAPASTFRAVLRWLPKHQQAMTKNQKTKLSDGGNGGGVGGCVDSQADDMGTTSGKLGVGRGRFHKGDASSELALAGGSLQERGEDLTDSEAMEELLSLRALRRDVMLCLLFGIISTLNRRDGRQPFGASPRRRARRQSTGGNSLQEEDGDESRSLLGGGRGPDRYIYSSGVGGGSAYDMDHFAGTPSLLSSGLPAPRRPPQQTRQRVMLPPVYNRELDFIDYERDAFVRLRRLHGISTEDYAHSLWGDHMDQRVKQMTEHFSSSRSGSFFYLTHDRRFLVKTMNSRERDVLLKIMPDYEAHLQAHPVSVLCRICGMHSVRLSSEQRFITIMVQQNVMMPYNVYAPVQTVFDLKGSSVDRQALPARDDADIHLEGGPPPDSRRTLKDMDLHSPLCIGQGAKAALQVQLVADTTFLHTHDIMDYSLMVGIHRCEGGCSTGHAPVAAASADGDEDGEGYPHRRDHFSQQLRQGLSGTWNGASCVFFVGIIDILQKFDAGKRLENSIKTRLFCKSDVGISSVHPDYYAERFVKQNMAKFR